MLCASAIELRAGVLTAETFRLNDIAHQMALQVDKPESQSAKTLAAIFKKYKSVDFSSTLIDASDIVDLVVNTRISAPRIRSKIRQHPYFSKPEDLPSWRALWFVRLFPREEHPKIVERFRGDFANRTFCEEGEINHVVGLALWLSKKKLPHWSAKRVVGAVKRYIDDAYKGSADEIDVVSRESDFPDAAHGLGYMNRDDPRFAELVRYHKDRRQAWRRRAYPRIASELLDVMANDSDAFFRDVCFNNILGYQGLPALAF